MSFFRDLRRWFFPKQRFGLNHGRRVINPYELPPATDEEKLLMLAGAARSPDDANHLFGELGTDSPGQILKMVQRRKKRPSVKEQLVKLIQRIDGHDPRSHQEVYGGRKYDPPSVRVQYRYRGRV